MKVLVSFRRKCATIMLAGVVLAMAATPASADLYTINFSDVGLGISSNFIIESVQPTGYGSGVFVNYNVDGGLTTNFFNTAFYQSTYGIPYNFGYNDGAVSSNYTGQALYSGNEASPTFNTGPFTLTRDDGSAETASISIAASGHQTACSGSSHSVSPASRTAWAPASSGVIAAAAVSTACAGDAAGAARPGRRGRPCRISRRRPRSVCWAARAT